VEVLDPFPRRREDPLPQTPYVTLDPLPVDRQPRQGLALRSVHPAAAGASNLSFGSRVAVTAPFHRLT
jgi:hypothetical protein